MKSYSRGEFSREGCIYIFLVAQEPAAVLEVEAVAKAKVALEESAEQRLGKAQWRLRWEPAWA